MCRKTQQKVLGLVLVSFGSGMLLVLFVKSWGILIGLAAVALGLYLLFCD